MNGCYTTTTNRIGADVNYPSTLNVNVVTPIGAITQTWASPTPGVHTLFLCADIGPPSAPPGAIVELDDSAASNCDSRILTVDPAVIPGWIKTTGGDVASLGTPAFDLDRDLFADPSPTNDRNGQFAVFANGANFNGVNTSFSSLKNWLVGDNLNKYRVDLGTFKDYSSIKTKLDQSVCTNTRLVGSNSLPNVRGKFVYAGPVIWNTAAGYDTTTCSTSGKDSSIVFINGKLTINNNFQPSVRTTLVVNGDIDIAPNVTEINAILIANGKISSGGGSNPLTITGAVISSLDTSSAAPDLNRDLGNVCSSLCNLNDAAETINFDPAYFYYASDFAGIAKTKFSEERP